MNPYAQIPVKILACLAVLLSPGIRADTLFTVRLGFDSHPLHERYHASYWPGYYRDMHRLYFYSPEFYGSHRPYYYIYFPSYYYSFYYLRPVLPFYYTYFYPWYFYPHHGYHRHDRHYSLGPNRHHDQHHHQERNHDHRLDAGALERQQHSSVSVLNRQAPGINHSKGPVTHRVTGDVAMNNTGRGNGLAAPAGKHIKILNFKNTGPAPRVTSPRALGSGRVVNRTGTKILQPYAVTRPGANKNFSPANLPAPRGRHISSHRSSPVTQSDHGLDTGRRQFSRGLVPDRHAAGQSFMGPQNTRGAMSPGVHKQQSSLRPGGRRDDQRLTTGKGNSFRTRPRSETQ